MWYESIPASSENTNVTVNDIKRDERCRILTRFIQQRKGRFPVCSGPNLIAVIVDVDVQFLNVEYSFRRGGFDVLHRVPL
jgi:hypothetical protein